MSYYFMINNVLDLRVEFYFLGGKLPSRDEGLGTNRQGQSA